MSLKAFHLVFISASTALAIGCGIWKLKVYWSPGGKTADLILGLVCLVAAVGLVLYERYFFKKMKGVPPL